MEPSSDQNTADAQVYEQAAKQIKEALQREKEVKEYASILE